MAKKWKRQTGGNKRDVHFIKMSISQAQQGGFVPKEDPNNPGFDLQGNPITRSSQDYPELEQNPDANIDVTGNLAAQQRQQRQQQGNAPNQPPKKIAFLDSPQGKTLNQGIRGITDVSNSIQNNKLQHQEKLQLNESMTPRFMPNPNSQGANNAPAYTKYGGEMKMGGPISHGSPIGVVDSNSGGPGLDESMYEGINHDSFYGQDMIYSGEMPRYRAGGTVSADKAKEILRDGTAQGHPLTDKQKRYFGWIAGGSKQAGGYYAQNGTQAPPPANVPGGQDVVDPSKLTDEYYIQNQLLQQDKEMLNNKLKAKNPQGYAKYFSGMQASEKAGHSREDYVQGSDYNDYLSPEEVKSAFPNPNDYNKYINSLKSVNSFNVQQGQKPLYGNIEGEQQDPTKINYGRRAASVQTSHQYAQKIGNYNRDYKYNPQTQGVDISESGDLSKRPSQFKPIQQPQQQQQVASRQTGGYSVGDEVELSAQEIKELKKQGYKIENI
jgi:hypothetical protein